MNTTRSTTASKVPGDEGKKRFSWRKEAPTGLYGSHMCSLRYGGKVVAKAQGRGDRWFWYSLSEHVNANTSHDPKPLAEVKAEALQAMRAAIRKAKGA